MSDKYNEIDEISAQVFKEIMPVIQYFKDMVPNQPSTVKEPRIVDGGR